MTGLRGLARAPWDEPDTSAADEAADLAAAAHQAQCDADDAAADAGDTAALAAQSRRLLALAVDAVDADDADLAAKRRARALIDRRHASALACGVRS